MAVERAGALGPPHAAGMVEFARAHGPGPEGDHLPVPAGRAHLPGWWRRSPPCGVGVPVQSRALSGCDSLLSDSRAKNAPSLHFR